MPYLTNFEMLVEIDAYSDRFFDDRPHGAQNTAAPALTFLPAIDVPISQEGSDDVLSEVIGQQIDAGTRDASIATHNIVRMTVFFQARSVRKSQLEAVFAKISKRLVALITFVPIEADFPGDTTLRIDVWAADQRARKRAIYRSNTDSTQLPDAVICNNIFFAKQDTSRPENLTDETDMSVAEQTEFALNKLADLLEEFGAEKKDILKLNTFYAGAAGVEVIRKNIEVRVRHFEKPGPAATGVPLRRLSLENHAVQFDVIGHVP